MKTSLALPDTDTAPSAAHAAMAALTQRWRGLVRQFDARSERERALLLAALMAVALMAADSLWLGPAFAAFRSARTEQLAAQQALQGLQTELARLQTEGRAQAQRQQAELASWRGRVRDADAGLRSHEDSLVGPDRMLDLLSQLLARHGEVRVRALRSLGRSDLLAGQAPAAPAAAAASAASPATATAGLYRHGVELVLEGGYADLLAYLKAMEALPQRVLWGGATLKVEQHPRSVLTIRVFTLSRDPHWLEI